MSASSFDVLILGGGPAGLGLAAALSNSELSVGLLSPSQPPTWPNSYGVWLDDVRELDSIDVPFAELMDSTWETIGVDFGDPYGAMQLDRPYGRLDNEKAIEALRTSAATGDVEWLEGWAKGVDVRDDEVVVETRSHGEYVGRLVVDATGHQTRFVPTDESDAGRKAAHQTAWGAWVRCSRPPVEGTQMMLMDFRDDFLADAEGAIDAPTFLYAMRTESAIGGGRKEDGDTWFVEETSLAARPPVAFDLLEARLKRRLAYRSVTVHEVFETERVKIPMGGPLPDVGHPIVALGGSAAMPHPATGYMIARAWQAADALGGAIHRVFDTADERTNFEETELEARARRAWEIVWPEAAIRRRRLYQFGLEALLGLDAAATREFFASFFALDPSDWRAYLGGSVDPGRLAVIMWRLFKSAPASTKWRLMQASMSSSASDLWRAWRGD